MPSPGISSLGLKASALLNTYTQAHFFRSTFFCLPAVVLKLKRIYDIQEINIR